MHSIDDVDKSILFELDKNSRQSVKMLAKTLNLKRDTVAYRIKRMESESIIQGYYALIDYSKLGYTLVRQYFKFQNTSPEIEKQIIDYLVGLKSTLTVYSTEGSSDVAIGYLVHSLDEFDAILKSFLAKFKQYIYESNTSIFLEYVHFLRNYLVHMNARNTSAVGTGASQAVDFDDTDIAILKTLTEDAKTPLLEIANKLGLSSMAVSYRIKQLQKKQIILGYKALINSSFIGFEYYKIDLQLEQLGRIPELRSYITEHPNIIYEDRTIGGSDMEFDAELEDYDSFYALLDDIKTKFPGIIRTYKFYKARKIFKYKYLPE
ncbi:Lrp/AsnC family transcriptional regulator [Candidatus Woesearchaeota archaeon]|nr:Lrp/AsnC family transcriptional regulator [Candidatus Woesearchaeota archaeon]